MPKDNHKRTVKQCEKSVRTLATFIDSNNFAASDGAREGNLGGIEAMKIQEGKSPASKALRI
jgi:hypothetical protein